MQRISLHLSKGEVWLVRNSIEKRRENFSERSAKNFVTKNSIPLPKRFLQLTMFIQSENPPNFVRISLFQDSRFLTWSWRILAWTCN